MRIGYADSRVAGHDYLLVADDGILARRGEARRGEAMDDGRWFAAGYILRYLARGLYAVWAAELSVYRYE